MIVATKVSGEKGGGTEMPVEILELMKGQKKRLGEWKVLEMGLDELNSLGEKLEVVKRLGKDERN